MERDGAAPSANLQTYIRKKEHEASKDESRPQIDTNCVGHGVSIRLQAAKKVGGAAHGAGRRRGGQDCTP